MNPPAAQDVFLCPITHELMRDPVVALDGHTYERDAITQWIATKKRSPLTNEQLQAALVIPNITLRAAMVAAESGSQLVALANNQPVLDIRAAVKAEVPTYYKIRGCCFAESEWFEANESLVARHLARLHNVDTKDERVQKQAKIISATVGKSLYVASNFEPDPTVRAAECVYIAWDQGKMFEAVMHADGAVTEFRRGEAETTLALQEHIMRVQVQGLLADATFSNVIPRVVVFVADADVFEGLHLGVRMEIRLVGIGVEHTRRIDAYIESGKYTWSPGWTVGPVLMTLNGFILCMITTPSDCLRIMMSGLAPELSF